MKIKPIVVHLNPYLGCIPNLSERQPLKCLKHATSSPTKLVPKILSNVSQPISKDSHKCCPIILLSQLYFCSKFKFRALSTLLGHCSVVSDFLKTNPRASSCSQGIPTSLVTCALHSCRSFFSIARYTLLFNKRKNYSQNERNDFLVGFLLCSNELF